MNLKKATIWLIIGVSYTVVLKLSYFLLPNLLAQHEVQTVTKILMLFVFLGQLLFLWYFYKEYLQSDQEHLKYATILSFMVPLFHLIFRVTGLFQHMPELKISLFEYSPEIYHGMMGTSLLGYKFLFSVIGGLILIYFFVAFYNELKKTDLKKLTQAVLIMLFVVTVNAFKSSIILLTYLFTKHPGTILKTLEQVSIIAVPLFFVSTLLSIYFYYTFYKTQD